MMTNEICLDITKKYYKECLQYLQLWVYLQIQRSQCKKSLFYYICSLRSCSNFPSRNNIDTNIKKVGVAETKNRKTCDIILTESISMMEGLCYSIHKIIFPLLLSESFEIKCISDISVGLSQKTLNEMIWQE